MITRVRGHSDDTVIIERGGEVLEVPSWNQAVYIDFDDGTRACAVYALGAWGIHINKRGNPFSWYNIDTLYDRAGDKETDVLEIQAEVTHWELKPVSEDNK